MPDEPEVHGLLALMLLHDARRAARFARRRARAARRPGPLALGPRRRSTAGRAALDRALALRGARPVRAPGRDRRRCTPSEPRDWPQIAALYGELAALTGSPVVELNRAVAIAEADGPEAGAGGRRRRSTLDGYHYLHADARRPAAPARPARRGARRVRARARAGALRAGAALPRAAARGARGVRRLVPDALL